MSPDLDAQLCRDFPLLFRDRHGSPMETSMCWGFPGDGWYALIRAACQELEGLRLYLTDPSCTGAHQPSRRSAVRV